MSKPNYLRKVAALLVLAAAFWQELAPTPQVGHPFSRTALDAGQVIDASHFETRAIASGILPTVKPDGVLLAPMQAGDPLVPSLLGAAPAVPEGWWGIDVPVPSGVGAGTEVRLVAESSDGPTVVPGVVIRVLEDDSFEGSTALIAVPEESAVIAAQAMHQSRLTVLVGS